MPDVMRTLGRYEVQRMLGRGGMAVVHLARQTDLDRLVALKELDAVGSDDPSIVARFLRESRLAGSLSHPNIVTVYDFFEFETTPFIAMEYIPGGSLRPYVGHLDLPHVAGVLEGILAGLSCAEREGIVHRDLKPENVMVTADGRVKIADFGIAKATNGLPGGTFKTATGMTLGTPHYIAPEQAMAQPVGPATDLYSLGCMAYEMVSGQLPFPDSGAPIAIMMRHVSDVPRAVKSVKPAVDQRISDWIDELLRKDPAGRPQSAAAAWDAFEEIVLTIEGPRWRRGARLPDGVDGLPSRRSLTPPHFEYVSHVQGPYTPPSSKAVPDEPPFTNIGLPLVDTPAPAPPPDPVSRQSVSTAMPLVPGEEVPAPPVDRSRRPSAKALAAGAVAAIVVFGAAIATLSSGGDGPRQPPASAATSRADVDAGRLRVSVPAGWSTLSPALDVPGLRLSHPAAVAPSRGEAAGAVLVGIASRSADNPTLLPSELVGSIDRLPARREVPLGEGGLSAFRYGGLRPRGFGRSTTIYAAPTGKGVATVACIAPTRDGGAFEAECARIAASLRAPGVEAFALGPDKALAADLDGALARLDRTVRGRRARIARAKARAGQASAANTLSAAYRRAAGVISRLRHGPADEESVDALQSALRRTAAGYQGLAAAARQGNPVRYRSAGARARAGETRVRRALSAFSAAGYGGFGYRPRTIPRLRPKPKPQSPSSPTPPQDGTPPPQDSTPAPRDSTPAPRDSTPSPQDSTPAPQETPGPKPTAEPIDPTGG